ncbi:hypothetical protein C1Y63_07600 [Corynebacterium sp. 13CS0277]|uniref:RDD family protein n=1 Tax=Corynebacterium sp. 13CS0277 TaxID=2071994 RepID=UPI000D046B49|nr:RDD family protein [Corynebacterium sp. 13CS0277]PRQ11114.1 hypothetical protein C1Y63_07600 [Corynebacterium sp. 13CS0277]
MADPQKKQSWLDTPAMVGANDTGVSRWPGEFLGLPQSGTGSLASVLRRVGGVWLDWVFAMMLAYVVTRVTTALGDFSTVVLIAFFLVSVVSVTLFARTPGQAVMGMGVARIDSADARVGVVRAVARALLTVLILPPVLVDSDGRGLHDRATQTAVIRG